MMKKYSITIAGNMGVGKSTLTQLLAKELNWSPFLEAVDDNPFLEKFFQDMNRWSFHSQVFFLSRRFRIHREMVQHPGSVIQDRSVYEDADIFVRNLYRLGKMSDQEYQLYRDLYDEFVQILPKPDLVVYLKASIPTLIARVQRRGRHFERYISPLYLQQLNELYNAWIEDFTLCPILTIDTDRLDFVRSSADFGSIRDKILAEMNIEPVYL
ncbi:MAG TPA: deoxynucleoside kinase [Anaerolineae bacterium]|nr:deoxynucleoside kinase [Anaerolineae bacterium]MCB9106437.1 deoxynucleoside kinase [Anaerolineales bacterium]HRV92214.1 deoxynucleoside kinase [Anaerolineae bacterium]